MDTLDGVSFINPDAALARFRRRVKLTAARARLAELASGGGGACSLGGGAGVDAVVCEKEVRKQQRMLRNRESAALSRKRKSDRIGELEIQVEALQEENRRLRQRIDRQDNISHFHGRGGNVGETTASPPLAPKATFPRYVAPREAGAPSNFAAIAALSATSVVFPSGSTANIIPVTPPTNNSDLAANNNFFLAVPDAAIAAAPCCWASAPSSCSPHPSSATSCFNIVSRPAVFA